MLTAHHVACAAAVTVLGAALGVVGDGEGHEEGREEDESSLQVHLGKCGNEFGLCVLKLWWRVVTWYVVDIGEIEAVGSYTKLLYGVKMNEWVRTSREWETEPMR